VAKGGSSPPNLPLAQIWLAEASAGEPDVKRSVSEGRGRIPGVPPV
jgi:hypothetical protein